MKGWRGCTTAWQGKGTKWQPTSQNKHFFFFCKADMGRTLPEMPPNKFSQREQKPGKRNVGKVLTARIPVAIATPKSRRLEGSVVLPIRSRHRAAVMFLRNTNSSLGNPPTATPLNGFAVVQAAGTRSGRVGPCGVLLGPLERRRSLLPESS